MKYYSDTLDKIFETEKELKDAEKADAEEKAKKEEAKLAVKKESSEVEDAFKARNVARRAYNEKLVEARKTYNAALRKAKDEFEADLVLVVERVLIPLRFCADRHDGRLRAEEERMADLARARARLRARDAVALMHDDAVVHAERARENRVLLAANVRVLLRFEPLRVIHEVACLPLVDDHDIRIHAVDADRLHHRVLVLHRHALCLADDVRRELVCRRERRLRRGRAAVNRAIRRRARRERRENHLVDLRRKPIRERRLRVLAHVDLRLLLVHLSLKADGIAELVDADGEVAVNQRFLVAFEHIVARDARAGERHEQRDVDAVAFVLFELFFHLNNRTCVRAGEPRRCKAILHPHGQTGLQCL